MEERISLRRSPAAPGGVGWADKSPDKSPEVSAFGSSAPLLQRFFTRDRWRCFLTCSMTRLSGVALTGWLLRQVEPLAPSQQNNATRAAISSLAASLSPASVVASSACASEFAAPTPPPADAQQVRRSKAWLRPHSANYKPDWVVCLVVLQVIAEEIGLGGSPSPTVRGYMLNESVVSGRV